MSRIRKIAIGLMFVLALAGVGAFAVRQASANATVYRSSMMVSAAGQTIPYMADPSGQCFGEDINLTKGDTLIRSQGTMEVDGFHGTFDVIRQGIEGVGVTTGDLYQITGTDTMSQLQSVNGAFTTSFTDHINVVGQGPDNNAVISSVQTVTVNANGQITSLVQNWSITCH